MKGIEQFLQVDAATLGALKYAGTWNASTNTPTLASGVGVQGQYYVVSVAGSTNLDGETNWQVGDWAVFNGSVWQKVDGGSTSLLTTLTVTGNTYLATTSGDVGIGTSSPAQKLHVVGVGDVAQFTNGTRSAYLALDSGGYSLFTGAGQTGNGVYANATSNFVQLFTNGTAKATLDTSGNLGLGTSSPAYKLDVLIGAGSGSLFRAGQSGVSNGYTITSNGSALTHFWATTGEAMRLDSAGNLGLGVTPSAWNTVSAFQVKNGSFYGYLEDESAWQQNAYYASGWKYISTGYSASQYMQISGQHRWFTAPSGTAGNAISFTQAMTLDGSGSLLVGQTSGISGKLQISGAGGIRINEDGAGTKVVFLRSDYAGLGPAIQVSTADPLLFLTNNTERMRITSPGDVGIGTTSPRALLDLNATRQVKVYFGTAGTVGETQETASDYIANNLFVSGESAGTMTYTKTTGDSGNAILQDYSRGITFYSGVTGNTSTTGTLNNFERMRLDASGDLVVGGTTTNSIRLTAEKSNPTRGIIAHVVNSGSSSLTGSQIMFTQNTVNNWAVGQPAGVDAFAFWSGRNTAADGTERMRIDSSGNLGLGVTPSAWTSYKALQINTGTSLASTANQMVLGSNWLFDGSDKYVISDYSTLYIQNAGQHKWYTAPSGTAGNAISFTQAMTLDASGNLGVGTSSPGARLHINSGGVDEVARFEGSGEPFISLYDNGVRDFYLFDSTEIRLWGQANKAMVFATNNNERARIDSSGNLLVGTTDNSVTAGAGTKISTGANPRLAIVTDSSTSNTAISLYSTGAAAYRFFVDPDGTVYATNTTISAISDQRFKENVRDLDVGLNAIMALKPRKFDWKAGKGKDIKDDRGFIAQELEQVFPDLVDEWKDPAPEGEEPYKSVRQDLIPVLVKAIQELNAKVQALEAQLGA